MIRHRCTLREARRAARHCAMSDSKRDHMGGFKSAAKFPDVLCTIVPTRCVKPALAPLPSRVMDSDDGEELGRDEAREGDAAKEGFHVIAPRKFGAKLSMSLGEYERHVVHLVHRELGIYAHL